MSGYSCVVQWYSLPWTFEWWVGLGLSQPLQYVKDMNMILDQQELMWSLQHHRSTGTLTTCVGVPDIKRVVQQRRVDVHTQTHWCWPTVLWGCAGLGKKVTPNVEQFVQCAVCALLLQCAKMSEIISMVLPVCVIKPQNRPSLFLGHIFWNEQVQEIAALCVLTSPSSQGGQSDPPQSTSVSL